MTKSECVYKLTHNDTGMYYIGSTINLKKRLKMHTDRLKHGRHINSNMQTLFDADGRKFLEMFSVSSVDCSDLDDARAYEQGLLDKHVGKKRCLNISKTACGGDKISMHPHRDKIAKAKSKAGKKVWAALTEQERAYRKSLVAGENNPMYGKTHTKEARRTISTKLRKWYETHESASLGRKLTEAQRKKLSDFGKTRTGNKNSFYGKTHSLESRKAIIEGNKNRDPSWKQNIVKAVFVEGKRFDSLADAHRALNIPLVTIRYRALSTNPKFADWYMEETGRIEPQKRKANPHQRWIYSFGKIYESLTEGARALNTTTGILQRRIEAKAHPELRWATEAEKKKGASPAKKNAPFQSNTNKRKLTKAEKKQLRADVIALVKTKRLK